MYYIMYKWDNYTIIQFAGKWLEIEIYFQNRNLNLNLIQK